MIYYRGQQLPILSNEPDWRTSINCTEEHSTVVRETIDTSEDRLGRRHRARFKLDFSISGMTDDETAFLLATLEGAGDLPFGVPFWQDTVDLTDDALEGQPWVDVTDATSSLFDVLDYVIIWEDHRTFTVCRRFSTSANQIILASPLDRAYSAGARVAPLAVGKLDIPQMAAVTDIHGTFQARFTEAFLTDAPMTCSVIDGVDVEATYFFESECVGGLLV